MFNSTIEKSVWIFELDLRFEINDNIILINLSSKPKLNNKQGRLIKYHNDKQRWQIQIDDLPKHILVKKENIQLI